MHELWWSKSILAIVLDKAKSMKIREVKKIYLEIGELVVMEPSSLLFNFAVVAKRTIAESAEIIIINVDGKAKCQDCGLTVRMKRYGDQCVNCGGFGLMMLQGDICQVKSMEVL